MAPAQKTSEMGADVDGIDNEDYSLATCDACGISVRGKAVFALPSGRTLVYCGHHARTYADAARFMGALIVELTPA